MLDYFIYYVKEVIDNDLILVNMAELTESRVGFNSEALDAFKEKYYAVIYGLDLNEATGKYDVTCYDSPQAVLNDYLETHPAELEYLDFGMYNYRYRDGYLFDIGLRTDKELPEEIPDIIIPSFVSVVRKDGFSGHRIASITFAPSITTIEASAFRDCTFGKTDIDLKRVEVIKDEAFCKSNITSVRFDDVHRVENWAFAMTDLRELKIPRELTHFGSSVFSGCKSLETVDIQSWRGTLTSWCFADCTKLATVVINGLSEIEPNAFAGCTALKEVTVDSPLEKISLEAFFDKEQVYSTMYEADYTQDNPLFKSYIRDILNGRALERGSTVWSYVTPDFDCDFDRDFTERFDRDSHEKDKKEYLLKKELKALQFDFKIEPEKFGCPSKDLLSNHEDLIKQYDALQAEAIELDNEYARLQSELKELYNKIAGGECLPINKERKAIDTPMPKFKINIHSRTRVTGCLMFPFNDETFGEALRGMVQINYIKD